MYKKNIYIHSSKSRYICICTYMRIHTCIYAYLYRHIYVHIYICLRIYTYTHTHTHTHIQCPTVVTDDQYRPIDQVGRVLVNGPRDRVIPKTQKVTLDTSLLNTGPYLVRIKGKVERSRKRSRALLYTSVE